jgi:hypothetical protein
MITRNDLIPDELVAKFCFLTMNEREREREEVTRRNLLMAYSALIAALGQKLVNILWQGGHSRDTPAKDQAMIYKTSQLELFEKAYTHLIGLYTQITSAESGEQLSFIATGRKLLGEKWELEGDGFDPDEFMVEYLIQDHGAEKSEFGGVLKKLRKYYGAGIRDTRTPDEMDDVRRMETRMREKGIEIPSNWEVILIAMRMWDNESIEIVEYPDVEEVIRPRWRHEWDNDKAMLEAFHGEPIDTFMFIDPETT